MTRNRSASFVFLLGALVAASPLVHAAGGSGNPLDPGYYVGHPDHVAPSSDATPYVDSSNPLSPERNYSWADAGSQWQGASKEIGEPYRDLNNPLYPGFQKYEGRSQE